MTAKSGAVLVPLAPTIRVRNRVLTPSMAGPFTPIPRAISVSILEYCGILRNGNSSTNDETSVERSNKRQKIDYRLEAGRHRSSMMWYIRLYGIMICQHIDAWYVVRQDQLQPLKTTLFGTAA